MVKVLKCLQSDFVISIQEAQSQMGLFSGLAEQLDQKYPLYILAGKIRWPVFEAAFKVYYNENMRMPSKPIR